MRDLGQHWHGPLVAFTTTDRSKSHIFVRAFDVSRVWHSCADQCTKVLMTDGCSFGVRETPEEVLVIVAAEEKLWFDMQTK